VGQYHLFLEPFHRLHALDPRYRGRQRLPDPIHGLENRFWLNANFPFGVRRFSISRKQDWRFAVTVERKELLLARGLGKAFSARAGLAHTVSRRLLRLGRAPDRRYVFQKVDFTLLPGECVALVGGNGSGKSTFLRCLGGVIEPTDGDVLRIGRLSSLLSHGFGAYEDLPVWQNIVLSQQLLGGSLRHSQKHLQEVAAMAELSDRLYSPTSHLSEGMRAKISLSGLAFAEFDVALLDESLNHVDANFRDRLFLLTRKWLEMGRSFVVTSHDEQLLQKFATRQLRFQDQSLGEID